MLTLLMRCIRASARSSDVRGLCARPSTAYAAHSCVGTLPILSFHFKVSSRTLACAHSTGSEARADTLISGGGLDELLPTQCCGCGIKLQRDDQDAQGFYVIPKKVQESYLLGELTKSPEKVQARPVEDDFATRDNDTSVVLDPIAHTEIVDPYEDEEFFDDLLDDVAPNKRKTREPVQQIEADPVSKMLQITCARCHKLSFEGRVTSSTAELELPEFDLAATVGAKIARRTARRAVVAVVVDVADFDGSLPRQALLSMLPPTWHPGSMDRLPFDIVLVVNKLDSLPRSVSHGYIENWVRARVKDANLPKPTQVHLVSCMKEIGVKKLLQSLVELVGIQGDLWIIGAQNAGKSSLINAMKYHAGTRDATAALTTAPLPGTTLDMVMVEGLPLMARSRCYDTPGVPHPYQITSKFGVEEVKQLLARDRPLKPRTYRVGANKTIFIGGVCRIDVADFKYGTVYLTVWASDLIPLHMGKTRQLVKKGSSQKGSLQQDSSQQWQEKADLLWQKQAGSKLNPPNPDSKHLVPELVPVEFFVEGSETQMAQSDIAIAGLGWVSCGLDGKAKLQVWTPKGVAVTRRRSLLKEYAKDFERPGWSSNSKSLFKYTPEILEEQRLAIIELQKEKLRKKARKKLIRSGKLGPKGQPREKPVSSPSAKQSVWDTN